MLKARRLLGVVTKGLTLDANELFVTRFRILHSMDGRTFVPYSDRNVTDRVCQTDTITTYITCVCAVVFVSEIYHPWYPAFLF